MRSRKIQKEEKAKLRYKMARIVDEANSLRDEAAEKMYDVPKGYKLNSIWDDVFFWLMEIAAVALGFGYLALFWWSLNGRGMVHTLVLIGCIVILGTWAVVGCNARQRPYRVEEHVRDYYVNEIHYADLAKELVRLKTGIADYNRQYSEREEYIQKFTKKCIEAVVEDYGSMELVLKANDFHVRVSMATATDEVNCRLELGKDGYKQLLAIIEFFYNSAPCV